MFWARYFISYLPRVPEVKTQNGWQNETRQIFLSFSWKKFCPSPLTEILKPHRLLSVYHPFAIPSFWLSFCHPFWDFTSAFYNKNKQLTCFCKIRPFFLNDDTYIRTSWTDRCERQKDSALFPFFLLWPTIFLKCQKYFKKGKINFGNKQWF